MAYFICEKQGRCCPHEFYDSVEQAIDDSEDGVPCDHLIEVAPVRHGRWVSVAGKRDRICSRCLHNEPYKNADDDAEVFEFCPHCGTKMDGGGGDEAD